MKDLNRMTARELETGTFPAGASPHRNLPRSPSFEPQGLRFVNELDGNELAHCAHGSVRDYIVTFDPDTVRGLLDVAIDAVSAGLDAVAEAERKRDAA